MKIGYLFSPGVVVSGRSNGVREQGVVWKEELERRGYVVDLLSAFGDYNWKSYSLVHVFQGGDWLRSVVPSLRQKVRKLVFSPIIDSNVPPHIYRIATRLEVPPLRMRTENVIVRQTANSVDMVLARSRHEYRIIAQGLRQPAEKIRIVKIGFRRRLGTVGTEPCERLAVCLHLSSFTQSRKNVARLIDASRLADVELWVAGRADNQAEVEMLRKRAGNHRVKFLGFQSDGAVAELMKKVRLFALPTICEGVGLAALEAAEAGCEVVITNRGGPPDYFGDLAHYVDPYDTESIAAGLKNALNTKFQPALSRYVSQSSSVAASVDALERVYKELI